jgi:hypothetical protein
MSKSLRTNFKYYRQTQAKKPKQTIFNAKQRTTTTPTIITQNNQIEINDDLTEIDLEKSSSQQEMTIVEHQADSIEEGQLFSNDHIHGQEISLVEHHDVIDDDSSNETEVEQISSNEHSFVSEDFISTALMSLFYGANFTKTALKSTVEFVQLLRPDLKIPKTFDQLLLRVEETKIKYQKNWFCQSCTKYVQLSEPKQRHCIFCKNK